MIRPVWQAWWTSARLTAKVNRFELASAIALAAIVAAAAAFAANSFGAIAVPPGCLRAWIASIPVTPACEQAAMAWSAASEGGAGRVMAAMAVAPAAVGLLAGVPLVAREIEAGTAPLAWAIAGSRWLWFARRVVPPLLLVVGLLVVDAFAAGWLADVRSANNIWSSTFQDADLFGLPTVTRGVACFAIGTLVGALVGRILPALIMSVALAIVFFVGIGAVQSNVVQSTHPLVDVGAPGSAIAFIRSNPDVEVFFVTLDNRVVTMDEAPSEAPPATPDPVAWLADHARLVTLGVSRDVTARWQLLSAALAGSSGAIVLGLAGLVVRRRAPR